MLSFARHRMLTFVAAAVVIPLAVGVWLSLFAPPLPFVLSEAPIGPAGDFDVFKGEGRSAAQMGEDYLTGLALYVDSPECVGAVSVDAGERFGPMRVSIAIEQTGCQDDSVEGTRLRVELQQEDDDLWVVLGTFRAQRCWTGRGLPLWHVGPCS